MVIELKDSEACLCVLSRSDAGAVLVVVVDGRAKCESLEDRRRCRELIGMSEREDPVRMHKQANSLFEAGKYKEAEDIFVKTGELYFKVQNFFDSTSMYYKAGECAFSLKDYEKAAELFAKSADLSFQKGFDRFGVSALEYARDSYSALNKKAKVEELEKKIKEVKKKLEVSF